MNKKASSLTNILRRKTNQNEFTKILPNKNTKNEVDYAEYSVTDEVPSYFNMLNVVGIF